MEFPSQVVSNTCSILFSAKFESLLMSLIMTWYVCHDEVKHEPPPEWR